MLGATISSLGPTLPFLSQNTGASLAMLGGLFAFRSIGYFIGSLGGGRLTDRLPGHPLLGVTLLVCALAMFSIPSATLFVVLGGLLLLVGLSEGALDVAVNTLLAWTHGPRTSQYMNGMFLLAGLGGFVTPLMFTWLGEAVGYRLLAVLNLPLAIYFFLLPSPPRQPHPEGGSRQPFRPVFYTLLLMLTFIYIGQEVSLSGWIYTYTTESGLGEPAAAASLNSLFWMALALGRLVAIPLAVRIPLPRLIFANLIGVTLSLGVILLYPASAAGLWIGALGAGFFMASIFTNTFAYAERQMAMTGTLAGVFWGSGSLGAMAFPWAAGWLFDRLGPYPVMLLLGGGWLAALVLFGLLMTYSNRRTTSSS